MKIHIRSLVAPLACSAALAAPAAGSGIPPVQDPLPAVTPAALAYTTSSGYVWVADAAGRNRRRLGLGRSASIAPDGLAVAAMGELNAHSALYVYGIGGQVLGHYFSGATQEVTDVAWSPDSRYLAVGLQPAVTEHVKGSIVLIDTSTGSTRTLARGFSEGISFAPGAGDRLVFALLRARDSFNFTPVDLYAATATGAVHQLTHDGHSLNPVYGARGIVFDRETLRRGWAPRYQLELLARGRTTQLTHTRPSLLVDGFSPVAVSADGAHLAVNFVGQDTDQAWTLDLRTRHMRRLPIGLGAIGISRDGTRLLLNRPFDAPNGQLLTAPFAGGKPSVLVRGPLFGTWNL